MVFHYHTERQAIVARSVVARSVVARSVVAAAAVEQQIVWAAKGESARAKGTVPHPRPGWVVAIEKFTTLPDPVGLATTRTRGRT